MIRKKQIYLYVCYLLLLCLIVILDFAINKNLRFQLSTTFEMNIPLLLITIIIPMIFGAVLGLDYILKESKKDGQWEFDTSKFIILGLTSLILSLVRLVFIFVAPFPIYIIEILHKSTKFFQILFGYIMITSFKKTNK